MSNKRTLEGGISVLLPSRVSASDVVDENERDTLYAFIVAIDEGVQDWDFTLKLCDYFEKQKQQWEAERAEDEAKQRMDNT